MGVCMHDMNLHWNSSSSFIKLHDVLSFIKHHVTSSSLIYGTLRFPIKTVHLLVIFTTWQAMLICGFILRYIKALQNVFHHEYSSSPTGENALIFAMGLLLYYLKSLIVLHQQKRLHYIFTYSRVDIEVPLW